MSFGYFVMDELTEWGCLVWLVVQYKPCCTVSYSLAKLILMIDFSLAARIVQVSKPLCIT